MCDVKRQRIARETIGYIAICTSVVIMLTCVFSLNFVPSESMEPTIQRKHLIVNWRLPYFLGDPVPEYGSIIVFRENGSQNRLLVKRVIGLPADVIRFSEGKVYRNGEELNEPYLLEQGSTYSAIAEFKVPDDALFVLGDNRYYSNDSRFMNETYVPVKRVYARELLQIPL